MQWHRVNQLFRPSSRRGEGGLRAQRANRVRGCNRPTRPLTRNLAGARLRPLPNPTGRGVKGGWLDVIALMIVSNIRHASRCGTPAATPFFPNCPSSSCRCNFDNSGYSPRATVDRPEDRVATVGLLALALLVPAAPPAARFQRGDELTYTGRITEAIERPGNRLRRQHELEVRVFVLERRDKWADAAVLTLLRRIDEAP